MADFSFVDSRDGRGNPVGALRKAWEHPMKITVYAFKWYDINKGQTFYPEVKRTLEWISNAQGAEALPGTAEVIDDSELDMHGAYHPQSKRRRNT